MWSSQFPQSRAGLRLGALTVVSCLHLLLLSVRILGRLQLIDVSLGCIFLLIDISGILFFNIFLLWVLCLQKNTRFLCTSHPASLTAIAAGFVLQTAQGSCVSLCQDVPVCPLPTSRSTSQAFSEHAHFLIRMVSSFWGRALLTLPGPCSVPRPLPLLYTVFLSRCPRSAAHLRGGGDAVRAGSAAPVCSVL